MFKKLRIQFVTVIMVSVALVLAVVFTSICVVEYQRSKAEVDQALTESVNRVTESYQMSLNSGGYSGNRSDGAFSGGPGSGIVTGWNRDNRGWWYLTPNGTYLANCWQLINGKWYCFGPDGYMRTGWINWNGVYYFCGPNGDMYTNCYTPDGYYVDANGVWVH